MATIEISGRPVGPSHRPFIIAEMSGNHNQSLERALAIVDAAAEAGADAVKIQTFTADTITINKADAEFFISDSDNIWKGHSLYELYQKAHTPWEWHKSIFERAAARNILCFSSPFDHTAVNFLESIGAPAYKIASYENIDIPLIHKAAQTGKPIIISTGMAKVGEISDAVEAVRRTGNNQLVLLKCTSTYPASPVDSNLNTIPHMSALFNCQVGLSDHTLGIGVAVSAVALGATVIEKHFTLSRADGGVDSIFSLEPKEFQSLVVETKIAWQSLGHISYGPQPAESTKGRRSLYIVEDIKAGEIFTEKNIRSIRPGYGLKPKHLEAVLGRTAKQPLRRGTALTWDVVG